VETLNAEKERILVIQTAFIGDAILTLPMIERLKQLHPDYEIDVLTIPKTEEIFAAAEYVDNVIIMDKKGKHKGFWALNKFVQEIKQNDYSKIYSPHRSFRSAYIALKLGVRDSYGFDNSSLKYVYNNLITYNRQHHEVQRNMELISNDFENDDWKIKPKINFSEEVKRTVNEIMSANQIVEDFIAIAPGSVWETKRYPKEYYIELIKLLINKKEIVILIGSNEDKMLCDEVSSDMGSSVKNLAGEFSIVESIWFLGKAKLLITNDSAPTHFGMCADIPVLTIYCSTVPEFGFYPYNKTSAYVSYNDLDCKPCGIHGYDKCPVRTFDCGKKLSAQKILLEVGKMLN
jgi:heptosyltransferase-2